MLRTEHVALFQGHSQILSRSCGEPEFSLQLQDKVWEWPGDKVTERACMTLAYLHHPLTYSL